MKCPLCNYDKIKNQIIFETKTEYVLYNKWAATRGQCIIPKKHYQNIRELTDKDLFNLMKTIQKVSKILKEKLNIKGFNYGFNENKIANQHFEHFHFHIIPRYENDNLGNTLLPKSEKLSKLNKEKLIKILKIPTPRLKRRGFYGISIYCFTLVKQ